MVNPEPNDDRMYCEMYSCSMSKTACIKRQENAKIGPGSGQYWKPGASDINCQDCEQGREIAKTYKKGAKTMTEIDERKAPEAEPEYMTAVNKICEKYGISFDSIRASKRVREPWVSKAVDEIIVALSEFGMRNNKIANILDFTEASIYLRLRNIKNGSSKQTVKTLPKPAKPEKTVQNNVVTISFSVSQEFLERLIKAVRVTR